VRYFVKKSAQIRDCNMATNLEVEQEYVQRRKQLKITELFGTTEYEDDYSYKQQRHHS
jgi:hypothetical protein